MIVVGCSGGVHIASQLAKILHAKYVAVEFSSFPDGESHIRLPAQLHKEVVVKISYDCKGL